MGGSSRIYIPFYFSFFFCASLEMMKCGNKFFFVVAVCYMLDVARSVVLNVWYHREELLRLKVYIYLYQHTTRRMETVCITAIILSMFFLKDVLNGVSILQWLLLPFLGLLELK